MSSIFSPSKLVVKTYIPVFLLLLVSQFIAMPIAIFVLSRFPIDMETPKNLIVISGFFIVEILFVLALSYWGIMLGLKSALGKTLFQWTQEPTPANALPDDFLLSDLPNCELAGLLKNRTDIVQKFKTLSVESSRFRHDIATPVMVLQAATATLETMAQTSPMDQTKTAELAVKAKRNVAKIGDSIDKFRAFARSQNQEGELK